MKKLIIALLLLGLAPAFALDSAGWMAKAKTCLAAGAMMESDETPEDGVYCLVMAAIDESADKPAAAALGAAQMTAMRKLTAFVHGEKVSASRQVDKVSVETTVDGEKTVSRSSKFEQHISSRVDAFMKGAKTLGQVTVEEKSYIVVVATENTTDESAILAAAKAEMGEGVVTSVGEAANRELAIEKAKRGAIEQVLGTMVIGYDKMSTGKDYASGIFSGTKGFVDEYRVVSESEVSAGVRVDIVAKVSKEKILDSYSTYLKFLGNPKFVFHCNSPDLQSEFTQFMTDLDIQVTERQSEAAYRIECWGNYRNVTNPMNGRKGIQLSLRFKITDMSSGDILLDMKNNPARSNCFIGSDPERQKEKCSELAFKQMQAGLHKNINTMIAQMVDRKMSAIAADIQM